MAAQTGCMFYNFGDRCVFGLYVAIYSLKQVYAGPITVLLAREDEACERLAKELNQVFPSVDVGWFDLGEIRTGSNLKPGMLLNSPYENTLMLDSDLLFVKPINNLISEITNHTFTLTRFHPPVGPIFIPELNTTVSGRLAEWDTIRGRVDDSLIDAAQARLKQGTDINIGVLGFSRTISGENPLYDWMDLIACYPERRLIDELAIGMLYPHYDHIILEEKYNCATQAAYRNTRINEACVLHYYCPAPAFGTETLAWYTTAYELADQYDLTHWIAVSEMVLSDAARISDKHHPVHALLENTQRQNPAKIAIISH